MLSQTDQLTVPVSGTDHYTVTAEDTYGCTETATVVVAGGPVDVEVPDVVKGCTDEVIQLVATNLDPNDTLTYNWYPPDKVSDPNAPDPVVTAPPGTYIFALAATNQFGCSDAYPIQVVVVDEHIALAFDHTVQCDGLTVAFDNQSQAAFDYVWDFGVPGSSADTSTAVSPTFIYPDTGTYVVTLDIAHDVGCVTPAVDTIVLVEPEVKADFTYDYSNCSEDAIEIAFYDQSYNAFNNTVSWQWTFSNGLTASVPNPVITVTQEGPLVASLTITTAQGCSNTTTQTLSIDFTEVTLASQIVLCKGDTTALNPDGDPSYQYEWIPAYNLSDPHAANPLAWPEQTTTYTVRITNFSADTCVLERSVTVFVPEEVQVDGGPDRIACEGPVLLNAVSPQAI
ncbi:MAG: PKD domain-containing protein, partial [Bacteroidetes bacterium]